MPNKSVPNVTVSEPRSQAMRAMLLIAAEPAVANVLHSILDIQRDEIHWDDLNYSVLSGGQQTALSWAYVIWTDGPVPEGWRDPFEGFVAMSASLQWSAIAALLCRHGMSVKQNTTSVK